MPFDSLLPTKRHVPHYYVSTIEMCIMMKLELQNSSPETLPLFYHHRSLGAKNRISSVKNTCSIVSTATSCSSACFELTKATMIAR
jgi:hypothetical protein